jgi:hypothetical protein
MDLNRLIILKNYKLPNKIKYLKKNQIKLIGKGYSGSIFSYNFNNKKILVKITKRWVKDLIYTNNKNALITDDNLNELVMLILFQNNIFSQKLYGYNYNQNFFYIFKEYNELSTIDYFKDKNNDYESKILIIILLFVGLHQLFQSKNKGFHHDFRLRNSVLKKTKLKEIKIKINNKNYIIPIKNYMPVLIDFELSRILNLNGSPVNIKPNYYYKTLLFKEDSKYKKFNNYHDLNFFYEYEFIRTDSSPMKNIIPKEIMYLMSDIIENQGKQNLNIENILNHKILENIFLYKVIK